MSMSVGPVATLEIPATSITSLEFLVAEVQRSCPRPVNMLQVAALLESAGVTDTVARQRYLHADVFALANVITRQMPKVIDAPGADRHLADVPCERRVETAMDYLRGPLALLPILLLSLTIMVYEGFGQWHAAQILTLSMAMIGSLLVTSGFVQVISRKGSNYLSQGYVLAARRVVTVILGVALVTVIITAGLFVSLLLFVGWLSPSDVGLLIFTYVSMSLLWLIAGVFFLLKQAHWFGAALAVGLIVSCLSLLGLGMTGLASGIIMLVAAIAGMISVLAVATIVIRRALSRESAVSSVGNQAIALPSPAQLLVGLALFFGYGVLYVVFVLSGHIGGWVAALRSAAIPMEAIGTIEVSLTLALMGYILAGGVAERTMRRFWQRVRIYQSATSQARPAGFNRTVRDFFLREQANFLVALVLCSCFIWAAVVALVRFPTSSGATAFTWTAESTYILILGQIGYGLMALGIFNCMFMITLSQPKPATGAVINGIAVTVVVGLGFAFVLPYQYATLGVVAGGLALALSARLRLEAMLKHADYYYFSSF